MNEQERAEEHLRTIRRLMERGTIYRAISAPTALVGGVLSLVASGVLLAPVAPDADPIIRFLPAWLLVLLLTAATNTLFIVLGSRRRKEPLFSASMKAAFAALAPAFLVAGVLTVLMAPVSESPGEATLAIIWATFYGLGLLATGHFAPRSLILLGWAFLISGLMGMVALGYAHHSSFELLNARNPALFMGATFGLYHLIYALCAWPRKGAEPEL